MDPFSARATRRTFLAATAAIALAACAPGSASRPAATSSPRRGGRLVEGVLSDVVTTNPLLADDDPSREAAAALYEPLYATYPDGRPLPRLAAGPPQVSGDGLTYRVSLRPEARWSDGSPVTAADVKLTYDLLLDPDSTAPGGQGARLHLRSVTATDQRTVEFVLGAPHAPFVLDFLTYGVLPRAAWGGLAAKDFASSPLNLAPALVSGAWKLASRAPGQEVVLARNDGYWGPRPYLDEYALRVLKDASSVQDALASGAIDFARLDPTKVAGAQAERSLEVVAFPLSTFTFAGFQLDPATPAGKIFGDRSLRQALLYGLDRAQLVDVQFQKQAAVAQTCMGPYSWAYDASTQPRYGFDPARAASLLDAAGWRKGQDGIRVSAAGARLSFTLLTNSGSAQREGLAVAIAKAWRQLGAEVTPKLVPFSDLLDQLTKQRTFDAVLTGFSWGVDTDQSALWHSRSRAPGGFNGMGYASRAVDEVLDQALASSDPAERKRLYSELQRQFNEDVPAALLAYDDVVYAFNRRVHGHLGGDEGLGTFTQVRKSWLARTWVDPR